MISEETRSLLERIQHVEDVLAINDLRARYCHLVDERRYEEVLALFTSDAEVHMAGSAVGTEELRRYWTKDAFLALGISHMWHFSHNQTLEIDGDHAWGEALIECYAVVNDEPVVIAAKCLEEFQRVNRRWLIAKKSTANTTYYQGPYNAGPTPNNLLWLA